MRENFLPGGGLENLPTFNRVFLPKNKFVSEKWLNIVASQLTFNSLF